MTVYPFRVGPYARNIYLYGVEKLAEIPAEYVEPVKEYAAKTYAKEQIDNALAVGYITQQEYDDTMAYKASIVPPQQ